LVLAAVPTYLMRSSFSSLPTNLLELLLLTACGAAWSKWLLLAKRKILLPSTGWLAAATLLVCGSLGGVLVSPHWQTSGGALKAWILLPLFYVLTIYQLPPPRRMTMLGGALLVAALLVSTTAWWGRVSTEGLERWQWFYESPNSLALFLAPLLWFFVVKCKSQLSYGGKVFWGGGMLVAGIAIIMSQSLGALGGLLLAGIIWFWALQGKRDGPKLHLGLVILVLVTLLGLGLQVASGKIALQPPFTPTFQSRWRIWKVSAIMLARNPITGTGLATFEPAYQETLHRLLEKKKLPWSPAEIEWVVRDPHQLFLSLWLNFGILGLAGFVWLSLLALRNLWLVRGKERKDAWRRWEMAAGLALLTLLGHGLVDAPFAKNDFALLFWVFWLLGA
jgi:O-antigen ligase